MRVMVFEPRYKGHHLSYVEMLLRAMRELDVQVIFAAGTDVLASDEYRQRISPFAGDMEVTQGLAGLEGTANLVAAMAEMLRTVLGRFRPEHVLVPTADGLVQLLGVRALTGRAGFVRGTEIDANLLRCRFAYPSRGAGQRIKLAMVRQTVRRSPISRLMTIDVIAYERLKRAGGALGRRLEVIPDPLEDVPVPTREEGRRMLGIPLDGRYLVLTGVLDERKGVDRLLRAFARASTKPEDRVLIAGKPQASVAAILADPQWDEMRRAGKLVTVEKLLSEVEIGAAIAAADVVCTPYIDHVGPSAMVTRSVTMGRPVLGTAHGWMGEMIPRLKAGWAGDTGDATAFSHAIERALAECRDVHAYPAAARLRAFLSPQNFCAVFLRRIRERLGLPVVPEVTWEAVVGADERKVP